MTVVAHVCTRCGNLTWFDSATMRFRCGCGVGVTTTISTGSRPPRPDIAPVRYDSLGSPVYAHQLPPEEPSDER